jgi:CP family cyanate transporter-like MFS transporter
LRRTVIQLGLVWLTGFNLRVVLFAIPPSLPAIRSELGLSFAATGSITSLAVLVLGVASIPGALLATRYGARRLVFLCGLGLAVFTFSVTLPPALFWVFAGTGLLTLSISLAQPPLAVLVRRWFPNAIARAGSLYANGLLMGSVLGGSLSPYLSAAIGWRGTFFVWAAVAGTGVLLWTRFTPRDSTAAPRIHVAAIARDPRTWQVAALFTFQNLVYYTVATWLPFVVKDRGPTYLATTLLFLNLFPILLLLALPLFRWQYALSTRFYVTAGLLAAAGSLGLLLGLNEFAWPLAFMVGLGAGAAFVGSVALPPLLATNEGEVAGFSAVMFTAGYTLAFAGPIAAGVLVDMTGHVAVAFWPPVVGAILMAVAGSLAPRLLVRSQVAAQP